MIFKKKNKIFIQSNLFTSIKIKHLKKEANNYILENIHIYSKNK